MVAKRKKTTKSSTARAKQLVPNTATVSLLVYCFTALAITFLLTAYYYYGT